MSPSLSNAEFVLRPLRYDLMPVIEVMAQQLRQGKYPGDLVNQGKIESSKDFMIAMLKPQEG